MRVISNLTITETWNKCMDSFAPIKIYWNDEIIWDDDLPLSEWLNPKAAFTEWAACHPDYKLYIVKNINIEIVDFHHSVVKIYGE